MGAANQKEAIQDVQHLLTASPPPDRENLQRGLAQYHAELTRGSEWFAVAEPIVVELLRSRVKEKATKTVDRLSWLLSHCANSLLAFQQTSALLEANTAAGTAVAGQDSESTEELKAQEAILYVTEMAVRHAFRLMREDMTVLNAMLERSGAGKALVNALLLVTIKGSSPNGFPPHRGLGVQVGVARLLVTLNASALYHHDADGTQDFFTETVLRSSLLDSLLAVLLQRLVLWGQEATSDCSSGASDNNTTNNKSVPTHENGEAIGVNPVSGETLYHDGCAPSLMSGLWSFFSFRSGRDSTGVNLDPVARLLMPWCAFYSCSTQRDTLFHHSAELFSLLAMYRRGSPLRDHCPHPVQRFIAALRPTDGYAGSPSLSSGSSPRITSLLTAPVLVSSVQMLEAFATHLAHCPALMAVLYCVVIDNPQLFRRALSSPPVDATGTEVYSRGRQATLQVIYQLLEMSFLIYQSRFEEALQQCSTLPSQSYSRGDAPRNPTPSPSPQSNPLSADKPLSPAQLVRMLGREIVSVAYPYLDFMIATLLFILSQDRVVNRLACGTLATEIAAKVAQRVMVLSPAVRRGGELFLSTPYTQNLSLGGLAVAVLCINISKAVREDNEALAHLFVVTLSNLSPFIHHLDAGSAQRLLKTISSLLRVLEKCAAPPVAESVCGKETPPGHGDTSRYTVEFGEMCLRVLRVMVESLEGMLLGKQRGNEHVVYELLYSREQLVVHSSGDATTPQRAMDWTGTDEDYSAATSPMTGEADSSLSPTFQMAAVEAQHAERCSALLMEARQMLRNVEGMIQSYYADIVVCSSSDMSAEDIMGLIRHNSAMASGGGDFTATHERNHVGLPQTSSVAFAKGEWLLYVYEESSYSYRFFGPFLWAVLFANGMRPGGAVFAVKVGECPLLNPE